MITVTISKGNQELALIRISNLSPPAPDGHNGRDLYAAEFVYDKMRGNTGIVRKPFHHNRLERNVLSLLKDALDTLEPHHLEFEGGPVSSSDLARRLGRVGATLQGWAGQLRNH